MKQEDAKKTFRKYTTFMKKAKAKHKYPKS
jgi:hypothetical protein